MPASPRHDRDVSGEEARKAAEAIWTMLNTRQTCQVCGSEGHLEDDHLPISSLLTGEPEDPRISAAEDARDYGTDVRDRDVW